MTRKNFIGSCAAFAVGSAIAKPRRSAIASRTRTSCVTDFLFDSIVEWIESTGEQWIDTGYCPEYNDNITLTGEIQKLPPNNSVTYAIFGCRDSPTEAYVGGQVYNSTIYGAFHNGIQLSTLDRYRAMGTAYKSAFMLSLSDAERRVDINWKTYTSYLTSKPFVASKSIYLFAFNGMNWKSLDYRLHLFEVEGKRRMIPVRFTNEYGETEGAMYDQISGGIYRNQGAGSFIIGPDV